MERAQTRRLLVTGGAGFIGSALVRQLIAETDADVINVDKLTYAGNLESLGDARHSPRHHFEQVDIVNAEELRRIFREHRPDAVLHLAAESHVDRSIDGPAEFVQTNLIGTFNMLTETLRYTRTLDPTERAAFRFIHVSTDEVFGSLGPTGAFTEETPYDPSSPYSATKAGSDHLARAWHRTYQLPVIITNCSNNYGPYHFPEKLIPLTIQKALSGAPIPVYGTGTNVRDWLYVDDHARALRHVLARGEPGRTYNVGGQSERTNMEVVLAICALLDELRPDPIGPHARLVSLVKDRPGHDLRYAINADRLRNELGWQPQERFESGLRKTVEWFLANQTWAQRVLSVAYRGERLGQAVT